MERHTLFITGAAGYVGAMLCEQFSKRHDVEKIIALDTESQPELLQENEKIVWITTTLGLQDGWKQTVSTYSPDIVIHTAWQIREMYGRQDVQWQMNVGGSEDIFAFVFSHDCVKRLIHFSTASIYGAFKDNTIEHRFREDESMREETYLYGVEKREVEERLQERWVNERRSDLKVYIVRPAAITGPRGRFARLRFGLQSALSGQLKDSDSFAYRIISKLVSVVPITKGWCRQFVHEDDVVDVTALLAFGTVSGEYEAFNLTPPGAVVRGNDMAEAVGKKRIMVPPRLLQFAYFFAWHLSRGKIPTSRGGWKFYSYPVVMDGTKVTNMLGHHYRCESKEAFTSTEGRYEHVAPPELRN